MKIGDLVMVQGWSLQYFDWVGPMLIIGKTEDNWIALFELAEHEIPFRLVSNGHLRVVVLDQK